MRFFVLFAIALGVAVASGVQAQGFFDAFGSIDPAWITDRHEPAGFQSVLFDGDNRLKLTSGGSWDTDQTTHPFYRTEGRQRAAAIFAPWEVSGKLYVSGDMVSGNNLRRTDLWARTGVIGNETGALYPIIGMRRFDPADPFNPSASSIASVWRVWDSDNGGWVNLAGPVTTGWHTLAIRGLGDRFEYYLNGNLVYTDLTVNPVLPDLTTVFVQTFNFNDGAGADYYWDDIQARALPPIPEPVFFQMGALMGLSGLGLLRLRRKA